MGRKRKQIDFHEALEHANSRLRFDTRNQEGLHNFSKAWCWIPQNGVGRNREVSITIDSDNASFHELIKDSLSGHRFFFSEFNEQFPWAVNALAISFKTLCLEKRFCKSEASYLRNAIGYFLVFCRDKSVELNNAKDLTFEVLCSYRKYLRSIELASRYKSTVFRRLARLIERIMETELFPSKFVMPVYASDAPEHLPPYSDAVMYQVINACIADIDKIRTESKFFEEFRAVVASSAHRIKEDDFRSVMSFYHNHCSPRTSNFDFYSKGARIRKELYHLSVRSFKSTDNLSDFQCVVPQVLIGSQQERNETFNAMLEKEVPTRDTLYPFFVLFLITSGKNKETVLSWGQKQKVGDEYLSPLECLDPFSSDRCYIRGYKSRGKGRAKIAVEDTYIKVSEYGLYPILEFLLWYVAPLSNIASRELRKSLWLYYGKHGAQSFLGNDINHNASLSFLERHEVWELETTADGVLRRDRITSFDTRRFRKVHASREFLNATKKANNFQELSETLKDSFGHKKFDTTLGSYLALGAPKELTDLGIFALQNKYVAEARTFRGARKEHSPMEGVPGLFAACADTHQPDYEGAMPSTAIDCTEFDMCFGCSQSRVFDCHLPRIAMRMIQYEELRSMMTVDNWEAEFGRKLARAQDLLDGWSDKEAIEEAWKKARSGQIKLPIIVSIRG